MTGPLGKAFRVAALVLAAALTVGAGLLMPRAESTGVEELYLPSDDAYLVAANEARSYFHGAEYTLVVVESSDPLSLGTVKKAAGVSESIRQVEGVALVSSLTNVEDVRIADGTLRRRALINPETYDRGAVQEVLDRTPLYRDLFIGNTGGSLLVYVIPEAGVDPGEFAERIVNDPSVAEDAAVFAYGNSVLRHMIARLVTRELTLMVGVAAAILFVTSLALFGKLFVALLSALAGLLPALWVIALFPLLVIPVKSLTMLAPVMTMVLSTTYSFHVLRACRVERLSHGDLLRDIGPVVAGAAGTTALGMASLMLSPEPQIRSLALLVIAGLGFAILFALGVLPILATRLSAHAPDSWEGFVQRMIPRVLTVLYRPRATPYIVGMILVGCAFLAAGIPKIQSDFRSSSPLRSSSSVFDRVASAAEHVGGSEQLELIIDTGEAYGLIDESVYGGVQQLHERIEALAGVAKTVSVAPFVGLVHGRLLEADGPVQPSNSRAIAEAFESLEEGRQALSIGSLVDAEWRRARYLLWFSDPRTSTNQALHQLEELEDSIAREVAGALPRLGEEAWTLIGSPRYLLRAKRYHVEGLYRSMALFFGVVVLAFGIVFRRFGPIVAIVLPAATAVVVYFGTIGWASIPLSISFTFAAILLLGVSNDDALYFALTFRRLSARGERSSTIRRTFEYSGAPIVQTTIMVVTVTAALYTSSYRVLHQIAMLISLGLVVSTLITLTLAPSILDRTARRAAHANRASLGESVEDRS